jgi:hypothetical protein
MRYAVEPVGFPKTKVGKWKFPAIFPDEGIAGEFVRGWYEEIYPDFDVFTLHKDELLAMVEDIDCIDHILPFVNKRITDDLLYVWCTPKGYFLVRGFN